MFRNKSKYFPKIFLQKISFFFKIFVFLGSFLLPEIEKKPNKQTNKNARLTDPTWQVRPASAHKTGCFFHALSWKFTHVEIHCTLCQVMWHGRCHIRHPNLSYSVRNYRQRYWFFLLFHFVQDFIGALVVLISGYVTMVSAIVGSLDAGSVGLAITYALQVSLVCIVCSK